MSSQSHLRPAGAPGRSPAEPAARPKVCLVGGPDVDARQALIQRLQGSFEVCAVGTDPGLAPSFARAGLPFRSYGMSRGVHPLRDLDAVRQLTQIFRAEQPDVVHTFDTKPGVWGRLAAELAGVPVVIGTLPGLGSLYATPGWQGRLARLAYQPLQTLACRLSDRTVFQNSEDAEEFVRRRVTRRARATVIPGSGVLTDVFAPSAPVDGARRRRELGVPETGVLVLMVSRVIRPKGVLELATAADAVRRADPTVSFLLVGPADPESMDALSAGRASTSSVTP